MIYYFLNSSFDVICWATKSFIIPYLAEYECKNEYDSYWAEIVCTSHEETSHQIASFYTCIDSCQAENTKGTSLKRLVPSP